MSNEEDFHLKIQSYLRLVFDTPNLSILPDLVGANHVFQFQGTEISVKIPSLHCSINNKEQNRREIYAGAHWHDEQDDPHYYIVNRLFFFIKDTERNIPFQIFEDRNKRHELIRENQQRDLNEAVRILSLVGEDAYIYWIRIMRWKSGIPDLVSPVLIDKWITYPPELMDGTTNRSFWTGISGASIPATHPISYAQWEEAQSALSIGENPPIWLEYWFDAEHKIKHKDFSGAIISLAISFESAVRYILSERLRESSADNIALESLENANISWIIRRIRKKSGFWDKDWDKHFDFEVLQSLLNNRNQLVHSAKAGDITKQSALKYSISVKKFIYKLARYQNIV